MTKEENTKNITKPNAESLQIRLRKKLSDDTIDILSSWELREKEWQTAYYINKDALFEYITKKLPDSCFKERLDLLISILEELRKQENEDLSKIPEEDRKNKSDLYYLYSDNEIFNSMDVHINADIIMSMIDNSRDKGNKLFREILNFNDIRSIESLIKFLEPFRILMTDEEYNTLVAKF